MTDLAAEEILPEREAQDDGREDEVHQPVRDEDDAECDHDKSEQSDRQIESGNLADMGGWDPDEQRNEDGCQQPGIDEQQTRGFLEEVLLDHEGGDHDRNGENHHTAEQRGDRTAPFERFGLEPARLFAEEPNDQVADQRGQQDIEQDEQNESTDHGTAPFAVAQGGGVFTAVAQAIFPLRVLEGEARVAGQGTEHLEIVVLSVNEDVPPDEPVAVACKVVALFHPAAHGFVMVVIHHNLVAVFRIEGQQVERIGKAGVAVGLALFVQVERFIDIFFFDQFGKRKQSIVMLMVVYGAVEVSVAVLVVDGRRGGSLAGDVESFVMVGAFVQEDGVHDSREAVGHHLDLVQNRRQAPQGFGQMLVALDFEVEPGHDFIERQPLLLIVIVLLGHLVEGVGDVEGVIQVLRIEDQGQLVAALRHFDQPLVLAVVAQGQAGAHVFHLLVLLVEFRAQDAEGLGEIAFVEDRVGGDGEQQGHQNDREKFLFHAETKYVLQRYKIGRFLLPCLVKTVAMSKPVLLGFLVCLLMLGTASSCLREQLLDPASLRGLSKEELKQMREEILARHTGGGSLSRVETANVELLREQERRLENAWVFGEWQERHGARLIFRDDGSVSVGARSGYYDELGVYKFISPEQPAFEAVWSVAQDTAGNPVILIPQSSGPGLVYFCQRDHKSLTERAGDLQESAETGFYFTRIQR